MGSPDDQQLSFVARIEAVNQCLERVTRCLTEGGGSHDDALTNLDMGQDLLRIIAVDAEAEHVTLHDKELALAVLKEVGESLTASRCALERSQSDPTSTSQSSSLDVSAASGHDDPNDTSSIASLRRHVDADAGLSSVAGMEQAKQLLTEAVVLPMRYRHLFTGARKPWRSVLLYGPPGTGKTRLALAVAAEVNAELYTISPSDLMSSWFGKTERNIRELFSRLRARSQRHSVIVFLDEVDGLCRRRSHDETESTRRMKTELLTQLQEGSSETTGRGDGQLFFVCATNCPWEIDPAFLRRFQRRIFIDLPDRSSRQEIIRLLARGPSGSRGSSDLGLQASEWQRLLDTTHGFSGSDLADLVRNALYQPIRELSSARYWTPSSGNMWVPCSSQTVGARIDLQDLPPDTVCARNVTIQDFIEVMANARPTVCQEDLARYHQFTGQFGQLG